MNIAARPSANLRRLMVAKGAELGLVDGHGLPKAVSARMVAEGAWPGEGERHRGRVEQVLGGHQPRAANIEAIAAYFGVDAGIFYQEPTP